MKAGERLKKRRDGTSCFVPVPVLLSLVTCPSCGAEVELWTGEDSVACLACDFMIIRKQRIDH